MQGKIIASHTCFGGQYIAIYEIVTTGVIRMW